ncbi:hypothetical protein [Chryseobacterium cheonjiense]|uniref:Uncharacterized protein n=1 Tax=Chryseobacterium cheonjiense TaxID=2728845 RepID=A0A7Y0A529_9FLAO|nr:hypothetical protein [Chryseobacterium cheonjiense]NML56766.1 hypothetical protein [Chryseobacterium cheonjiense]
MMGKVGIKDSNLKLIGRFYDYRILGALLFLYLVVYWFPVKFVTDYFHIGELENFRTFIWRQLIQYR